MVWSYPSVTQWELKSLSFCFLSINSWTDTNELCQWLLTCTSVATTSSFLNFDCPKMWMLKAEIFNTGPGWDGCNVGGHKVSPANGNSKLYHAWIIWDSAMHYFSLWVPWLFDNYMYLDIFLFFQKGIMIWMLPWVTDPSNSLFNQKGCLVMPHKLFCYAVLHCQDARCQSKHNIIQN